MTEGTPSGGASPNGTGNDSSGSSTQSNAAPRKSTVPRSKKKRTPKKSIVVVTTERANRVVASAAPYGSDKNVASCLKAVTHDRLRFDGAVGAPVESEPLLTARDALKKSSRKVLYDQFEIFSRCIGSTSEGREFLERVRGKTNVETARNAIALISPQILKHNQPLLDELSAALGDFDRASSEYDDHVASKKAAKEELAFTIKRLRLSLRMLEGAVKIAASEASREKLGPPKKSKHPRSASA